MGPYHMEIISLEACCRIDFCGGKSSAHGWFVACRVDSWQRGINTWRALGCRLIVGCKSIYDHLQSYASPGSVGDKRVAIDLVIVRETLQRLHGSIR